LRPWRWPSMSGLREARGTEFHFGPFPLKCNELERAGRVKGGAAAERSEGTLEAPEHSDILMRRGMVVHLS
jgi:hypothetical protein